MYLDTPPLARTPICRSRGHKSSFLRSQKVLIKLSTCSFQDVLCLGCIQSDYDHIKSRIKREHATDINIQHYTPNMEHTRLGLLRMLKSNHPVSMLKTKKFHSNIVIIVTCYEHLSSLSTQTRGCLLYTSPSPRD